MALRSDGALAQTFRIAIDQWDREKAAGVSRRERVHHLSLILTAAWPRGRTDPWRVLCQSCEDYGWAIHACAGEATCGRLQPHYPHEYATACWCEKGKPFQPKPKPSPEDFSAAARVRKPTRIGR